MNVPVTMVNKLRLVKLVKHKNILKTNERKMFLMAMLTSEYLYFEGKKYKNACVEVSPLVKLHTVCYPAVFSEKSSVMDVSLWISLKFLRKTF